MPVDRFDLINDAGQVFRSELERLARTVQSRDNITSGGGLGARLNAGGISIVDARQQDYWVKITGPPAAGGLYPWSPIAWTGPGTFMVLSDMAGTPTNIPAVETNGNMGVPIGRAVKVTPSDQLDSVRFTACQ